MLPSLIFFFIISSWNAELRRRWNFQVHRIKLQLFLLDRHGSRSEIPRFTRAIQNDKFIRIRLRTICLQLRAYTFCACPYFRTIYLATPRRSCEKDFHVLRSENIWFIATLNVPRSWLDSDLGRERRPGKLYCNNNLLWLEAKKKVLKICFWKVNFQTILSTTIHCSDNRSMNN